MRPTRVLALVLCLTAVSFGRGVAQAPPPPCPGYIAAQLQPGVGASTAVVSLLISLVPNPQVGVAPQPVTLRFEQGEGFAVDPPTISLAPNDRAPVRVTVRGENPGLVQLRGHPTNGEPGCLSLDTSVDIGFDSAITLRVDDLNADFFRHSADGGPRASLDANRPRRVQVRLVTKRDGRPVNFDAPITTQVSSDEAVLSLDGKTWPSAVTTTLQQGWSPDLLVKPVQFTGAGTLQVALNADPTKRLATESFLFATHPPFFFRLLIGMLGGFVYAVAALLADKKTGTRKSHLVAQLLIGVILGGIAVAFAEEGWLPLTIKKSDALGYLVVGVLFASLGLDGVIKRVQKALKV